jgi:diaminopimelate decarboxylase
MAQTEHEIILEAGRAVTSSAQTLVLSVIAVKETAGRRRLILDGGKNITLPLGWETHKIFPVCGLNDTFNVRTDLYGPLCHPGDIVAEHLNLPRLETGDAVCIMDAGAYFVPNQMNFSNPRPPIVTVEAGSVNLVRQRESFDDIVRLDDLGTSA